MQGQAGARGKVRVQNRGRRWVRVFDRGSEEEACPDDVSTPETVGDEDGGGALGEEDRIGRSSLRRIGINSRRISARRRPLAVFPTRVEQLQCGPSLVNSVMAGIQHEPRLQGLFGLLEVSLFHENAPEIHAKQS